MKKQDSSINQPSGLPSSDPSLAGSFLNASALARLEKLRWRARFVIRCEQIWRSVRWPVALLLIWLLASLLHLPQYLPDFLRWLIEGGLFYFVIIYSYRKIAHFPPLSITEIDHRLEADSRLKFHPLTTLTDKPAIIGTNRDNINGNDGNPGHIQRFLWRQHCARLLEHLDHLSVSFPRFFVTWHAKIAFLLICGLAAGILFQAGAHFPARIKTAFLPWSDDDSSPLPHLQAWIEYPPYAQGAPVFLSMTKTQTLPPLPEGSVLHLLLTESYGRPSLSGVVDPQSKKISATTWQIQASLKKSGMIKLRLRSKVLATWPVTLIADTVPHIAWSAPPKKATNGWVMNLPWTAEQNFGLAHISVILTPLPTMEEKKKLKKLPYYEIPLPLMAPSVEKSSSGQDGVTSKDAKTEKYPLHYHGVSMLDLSDHPLAGRRVMAQLKATSLSGKIGYSESKIIRVGARPFHSALARGLLMLRQRLALGLDDQAVTRTNLSLLAELPFPSDEQVPLALMLTPSSGGNTDPKHRAMQEKLWFLALYAEDRAQDGLVMALSMAELRATHEDIARILVEMQAFDQDGKAVPLLLQEKLHQDLQNLKASLDRRMALMMQKASQTGIIMPLPNGRIAPWNSMANKLEEDAGQKNFEKAKETLHAMMNMAEEMRGADNQDLQALAQQMAIQKEERAQHAALRVLIKQETQLLNHTQARFNAAKRETDQKAPQDISQMSTADLLRQLGMTPPDSGQDNKQENMETDQLDHAIVLEQGDARQNDHILQHGLQKLDRILLNREKTITHKTNEGLAKAEHDMQTALDTLSYRQDHAAMQAEKKVLEDLSQAQKQMRKQREEERKKNRGKLGFIPPPQPGGGNNRNNGQDENHQGQPNDNQSDQGNGQGMGTPDPDSDLDDPDDMLQDDDHENGRKTSDKSNRDPLGRKVDNSEHSDAHIPDKDNREQTRKIERELRKRASDRTRSQHELDYLNRLLAPFKGTMQ